jgi:hypothetical protein
LLVNCPGQDLYKECITLLLKPEAGPAMKSKFLIAATCCFMAFGAPCALALAQWAKFSDPAKEINIIMPGAVKASKNASGNDDFEAKEADTTYRLAFRRRYQQPADKEEQVFCDAFARKFEEVMNSSGDPIKISLVGHVTGKNWQGRIYSYTRKSGTAGALQIAIGEHHNYVLHVIGGAGSNPATKRYFSSFEVN